MFDPLRNYMILFLLTYLLTSNALTLRKDKSILFSRVVMISLFFTALLTYNNLFILALDKGIGLFGGLFHVTPFTQSFNIFIFIICSIILNLTSFYPRKAFINKCSSIKNLLINSFSYNRTKISNKMGEQYRIMEYSLVIVFVITGALFLMSASDLVSVFLSLELQSYGLYIISCLYRDSEQATSGGLTYFLLGGLSSCFILLGSAFLYINSGTTNLDGIYLINSITTVSNDVLTNNVEMVQSIDNITNYSSHSVQSFWYQGYYIHRAIGQSLIILSVGFLFKVSAAPFHFWSPDVYDAIPTLVTTFVAIIAKISIFIFLLELVYFLAFPIASTTNAHYVLNKTNAFGAISQYSWSNSLLISSLLSLIIGSVLGLTQFRIKRLFAYSTISHVGFILLALSINSVESIQAYIFYIIAYTISNLNAFLILLAIGYSFYTYVYKNDTKWDVLQENFIEIEKNNSPIQLISQIKGYFYINPYLALSLAITLFSFVGVPPLIGFFAKQMVLSAGLDNGYVFMTLVAILTSVIGAVYYLNVIRQIFFYKSDYEFNPGLKGLTLYGKFIPTNNINVNEYHEKKNFSFLSQEILSQERLLKKEFFWADKNIVLSSALSTSISVITLILLLFIYIPKEWFSMANILSLTLFKP